MPKAVVAEDEEDIRVLLTRILERDQIAVRQVMDGPSALVAIREDPPDLAVLDGNLTGMSGFEILDALRADPVTANVRVIMVSGLADPADVERALRAGADDYVTKPFQPRELTGRIRAVLEGGPGAQETPGMQGGSGAAGG